MTSTDSKCPFMVLVGTTEQRQRVFIIAVSVCGTAPWKGSGSSLAARYPPYKFFRRNDHVLPELRHCFA